MDEFDFEKVPLEHPAAGPAHASSPAPLPAPFAARLSPRARLLRVGGILGVLLLAVAVLVAVTPGERSAVVPFVLGPTPTATLAPPPLLRGYDHVAVAHQVPWATLLVDGHPAPSLPLGATSNLP